jgi:hypothetical protein
MVRVPLAFLLGTYVFCAHAAVWNITPTVQDGTFQIDSPTIGMLSWSSTDLNGTRASRIYGSKDSKPPAYACYGLGYPSPDFAQTCEFAGKSVIWQSGPAVYSTGRIDDSDLTSTSNFFTWTGQTGTAMRARPDLFVSSIVSGTYLGDGTVTGTDPGEGAAGVGYDADGFSCWNSPYSPGKTDFCGNGTGINLDRRSGTPRSISSRFISNGLSSVADNMDGTITITMTSSTYTDCIADSDCTPGSSSSDLSVVWRLNATAEPR